VECDVVDIQRSATLYAMPRQIVLVVELVLIVRR